MSSIRSGRRERRGGFTLMEVLLVMVILVSLATLSIGVYSRVQKSQQIKVATAAINNLKSFLYAYYSDTNGYPTTSQGLNALLQPPGDLKNPQRWSGPYVEKVPDDPWGNPFQYASPGTHKQDEYDLWSLGPDGQSGTADDIGNWQ